MQTLTIKIKFYNVETISFFIVEVHSHDVIVIHVFSMNHNLTFFACEEGCELLLGSSVESVLVTDRRFITFCNSDRLSSVLESDIEPLVVDLL